jgi:hypothetical protein
MKVQRLHANRCQRRRMVVTKPVFRVTPSYVKRRPTGATEKIRRGGRLVPVRHFYYFLPLLLVANQYCDL